MQVQEESLMVSKDETQMMIMIKGKRTKRQRAPSPLRLAMPISTSSSTNNNSIDSATTATTIESSRGEEEEYMANCLILLAQGRHIHHVEAPTPHNNNKSTTSSTSLYLYQCKTCNRCFPSFQALGGHRASHKKPKQNGAFSSEPVTDNTFIEDINNNDHHHHRYSYDNPTTSTTLSLKIPNGVTNLCSTSTTTTKVAKVHECSICGAEFSSGQALGGHMRRHRTLVNVSATTTTSMSGSHHELQQPKKHLKLDLNLPAPLEDDHRSEESKFSFQKRENVIVFSKPSLVDCHY